VVLFPPCWRTYCWTLPRSYLFATLPPLACRAPATLLFKTSSSHHPSRFCLIESVLLLYESFHRFGRRRLSGVTVLGSTVRPTTRCDVCPLDPQSVRPPGAISWSVGSTVRPTTRCDLDPLDPLSVRPPGAILIRWVGTRSTESRARCRTSHHCRISSARCRGI
jgi:hypothetical protein